MSTSQSKTRGFAKGLLMLRLRRKQLRLIQTLCCFALLTVCFMFLFTHSFTYSEVGEHVINKYTNMHFRRKVVKKILMWLPHANKDVVRLENECLKTCPVKCVVTGEKNDIEDVDAIDFHLSNLWTEVWSIGTRSIIDFPKYRRPDQVWIVSNMEPPQNLWGDIKVLNGVFNWTRWYRTDSTVLWPYGFQYRLNETERSEAARTFSGQNIFEQKTKNIVGRVSNCNAPNRRLSTIKRMGRYIKIDMQGACFGNPCGTPGDESDTECNKSLQDYKFFLAFENNDCVDYVTEKYWYTLKREQIPIVNWKHAANKDIVIPGSYINIYDFENIQSAMEYVKDVSENENLYNSYFDWRLSFADRGICSSCEICKRLHDEDRPAQVIEDLDAWVRNDTCGKMGVRVLDC